MSSKNYVLANEKKKVVRGHTYDGKELLVVSPSLHETTYQTFFNPISGGVGTTHRVDINLSSDDEWNTNEILLEFRQNNLDTTLSQVVRNPWLLFSEIKLLVNNQELCYYDNTEKIFCAQALYYSQFNSLELKSQLQELMPLNHSNPLNGETIAAGASLQWSLPVLSVLFKFLKDFSRSQGIYKISIEFRFQPNTAVMANTLRFISSSTNTNPYTASTVSFTDITARIVSTKHSDPYLRMVPSPMCIIENFEDRMFNIPFNVVGASRRIQLSTEYSARRIIHGIFLYAYDPNRLTTWNDSDAHFTYSGSDLLGFEVRYKTRSIIKMDTPADEGKRVKYYIDNLRKRWGKAPNTDLIDDSNNTGKHLIPLTFIDFQNVQITDNDIEKVHSGLPNQDIEIIVTNCSGAFSTSAFLFASVCYYEFAFINPKTGIVSFQR